MKIDILQWVSKFFKPKRKAGWKITPKNKAPMFFCCGSQCIYLAKDLFDNRVEEFYAFGILYIHGIELLLKSFLILRTGNYPEIHDCLALYQECRKYDNFPENDKCKHDEVWNILRTLSDEFYIDTVAARYNLPENSRGKISIKKSALWILDGGLINPLKKIIEEFDVGSPLLNNR